MCGNSAPTQEPADYDRTTPWLEELAPVFIATTLKEAKRVEHALLDVHYVVEVEPYSRSLFGTLRYGATFYVVAGQADYCRSRLVTAGLHRGVIDHQDDRADSPKTRTDP
jgi:hypothetical protein